MQTKPQYHLELDEITEKALTADRNVENNLFPDENAKRAKKAAEEADDDDVDDEEGGKKKKS